MTKSASFLMMLLMAGAMTLATLSPAPAAETTVSGTLVDVAKWVTGDANTTTLNMPGIMMSTMMATMMANASAMAPGAGGPISAHHPSTGSAQSMPNQGSPMEMMGGMMQGCHATLGVVTSSGELYVLLANRASPMGALALCGRVGQHVTVTGPTYSRGGVRALLVSKLPV